MKILTKDEMSRRLREYYEIICGERESDVWYDQPAVNVWTFGREDRIITLHVHILTGKVTEYVEKCQ